MQRLLNNHYQTANEDLQHAFERMLEMQDPELYDILVGRQDSGDQNINQVIEHIYR